MTRLHQFGRGLLGLHQLCAKSASEKQWLEIGMLLMQAPRLLLVDEPVAGMSPQEVGRRDHPFARCRVDGSAGGAEASVCPAVTSDVKILDKGRLGVSGAIAELTDDLVQKHLAV